MVYHAYDLDKKDKLRILQITDCHLFLSNNESMMGFNNNKNFFDVIHTIKNDHVQDTDLIFLTGDLSQDETIESYEHIASQLKNVDIPIYWIPGNHDNQANMAEVFSKYPHFVNKKCLELKHWVFVFLNTQKIGSASGFLDQDEMNFLGDTIVRNKDKKIAVVMHHHPTPFNTPLIDNYILENRDIFWRVIDNSSVKIVLCGHVHGDYSLSINNVQIESAPATCFQFKKGSLTMVLENNIGYKIYYFDCNGVRSKSEIWMEQTHVNKTI